MVFRRICLLLLAPMLIPSIAIPLDEWLDLPRCFSYFNFDRIEEGMKLERVQELLGTDGEEILLTQIPYVPPYDKFPEPLARWHGVVWGERCYCWTEKSGDRTIYVGVTDGRIVSKYIHEYYF